MQRVSKFCFVGMATLVALMGTVAGLCCHGWQEKVSAAEGIMISDIDSFISERMAAEKIPGMAVVVVEDSQVTYLKGFGTASLNNPSPVTAQE